MDNRTCPICESNLSNLLYTLEFYFPNKYFMDRSQHIVSCIECGFVFNKGNNDMTSHSTENNRYEGISMDFSFQALDYIINYVEKEAKILDAGCGRGFLLSALKKEGYKNLYGLDPSKVCINNIDEGINGKHGSIYDNIPDYENFFDIITFTNVIEHLDNPSCAIKNISLWLKREGICYIVAPNALFYHLDEISMSCFYCAEHVNHFTKEYLNFLLSKYNLVNIVDKDTTHPIIMTMVYEKRVSKKQYLSKSNHLKKECIKAYNRALSKKQEAKKIFELHKGKNVVIWGMSHQFMFMYPDVFNNLKIEFIVDSDESKHKHKIDNIQICSPTALSKFNGSIVVLDNSAKKSILKNIEQHGFKQEIICL